MNVKKILILALLFALFIMLYQETPKTPEVTEVIMYEPFTQDSQVGTWCEARVKTLHYFGARTTSIDGSQLSMWQRYYWATLEDGSNGVVSFTSLHELSQLDEEAPYVVGSAFYDSKKTEPLILRGKAEQMPKFGTQITMNQNGASYEYTGDMEDEFLNSVLEDMPVLNASTPQPALQEPKEDFGWLWICGCIVVGAIILYELLRYFISKFFPKKEEPMIQQKTPIVPQQIPAWKSVQMETEKAAEREE